MAIKRATLTLTVGADGVAEDDVRLSGFPTSGSRHGFLECVTFDDSAASRQASLFIYQVEDDDNGAEQAGTLLFQADRPDMNVPMYPRVPTVDAAGVAQTEPTARILIRSSSVRAKVTGALVAADVYTVVLYYETAGDYRF